MGVYLFKGEEEQNETPFKNKMNHPSKMKGTMNLIALPLALLLRRVILLFIQSYTPMLPRHYTNQFTLIIIINHKRTRHKSTKNLCNMLIIYAYNCHFLMTQLDLCNMQQKSPPTIQQPWWSTPPSSHSRYYSNLPTASHESPKSFQWRKLVKTHITHNIERS